MSCKYNNCKICGYKSECEIYKENAELKDVIEGYKKIAKWCDKCDKIAELEKENAELKENCNSLQELVTYYQTNFCQE